MRVATSTSLQIGKWRSADQPFIAKLALQAFAEYDGQPTITVQRLVQHGATWVARRGDTPVGFAIVHPRNRHSVELCAIAVEEEARGRGVGRALVSHIERTVIEAGLSEIRLHTAEANLSALELFLKSGYRVERRMPRFYCGMYDACALVKHVGLGRAAK